MYSCVYVRKERNMRDDDTYLTYAQRRRSSILHT